MASRLDTQTNIRLTADLKRALVDAAAENRRSLSAEIEARLAESFSGGSSPARISDFSDLSEDMQQLHTNLTAVIDQLRDERERNDRWNGRLLETLKDAVRGFDEALLLARYKNGSEENLVRLQQQLNIARASIEILRNLLPPGP